MPETQSNASPAPRRTTVLIVDDEEGVRDILQALLHEAGYEVLVADSSREGMRLASLQPDVILLDYLMPLYDGVTVCRQLQAYPPTAHIPILFLTAFVTDTLEREALEAGAYDVLYKPVRPEDLFAKVAAAAGVKHVADPAARRKAYRDSAALATVKAGESTAGQHA